jgi:hypothetical protein
MVKGKADLTNEQGVHVATFNETGHNYGVTVATVRLDTPVTLQGTEILEVFAQGIAQPIIYVEASDPAGTEIREFHGRSAIGSIPDGTSVALVKSPGGDLSTLLIVLGSGTVTVKH